MTPSGAPRSPSAARARPVDRYVYRRPLGAQELLPAIGVGIAVGAVAFYVARLLLQRTPFEPLERPVRTSELPEPADWL